MKLKIISTEKIKDKYVKDAIQEYTKRLSAYCKVEYVEAKNPTKEITDKSYVIKIDKDGEQLSSEQLAGKVAQIGVSGNSNITIFIGVDNIEADYVLSISRMDIDINILLIVIYEQIYRAYRIINNAPYHK
ncbi:23S rRNA (pseudouridine(1915)-N(3))-methyltransferase RlmH [Lutispora saccharofermentans]|jgi:23S rRNA (pseudouridine1915-N3)-methyltransferase|uniref:Ribosomal RNA large subunit methyltransferase H n=1 Tax=Lutispora saccharofermentans TaxID=3024236 RepID=A0ABT1NJL3_9FIRM|nr:23S rRNA (pseudouridine(1915)-N(3))-methyltransferase RlmH [Lutispora saccharofermentans]MCQ1531386.1 23S rRNA (pseudouridine(1915)-N(3))-methyltransferase RlmH [Lutispora saccharofermentans]